MANGILDTSSLRLPRVRSRVRVPVYGCRRVRTAVRAVPSALVADGKPVPVVRAHDLEGMHSLL